VVDPDQKTRIARHQHCGPFRGLRWLRTFGSFVIEHDAHRGGGILVDVPQHGLHPDLSSQVRQEDDQADHTGHGEHERDGNGDSRHERFG